MRCSPLNHPFWDTPISGNLHLGDTAIADERNPSPGMPARMDLLNPALLAVIKAGGTLPAGYRTVVNRALKHFHLRILDTSLVI